MKNDYINNMSQQFKNKVVIVTGSTQGSGAETAKLLAARGAEAVTICGRQEKKGNEVKKELESFSMKWKPYRTVACWYLWKVADNS